MPDRVCVIAVAEVASRHGVIEDEAGTRHEMPRVCVVYRSIITKEMIEAAVWIDRAWVVKRHGMANMIEQKRTTAKVRRRREAAHVMVTNTCSTKSNAGGVAPGARQAALAAATPKRR